MSDSTDVKLLDEFVVQYNNFRNEISKVIVGQDKVVKEVLISIFCNGHCLLVGVPGLAKTLLVQTISDTLGMSFNRIQFTPDLMPSDIVRSEILDENRNFKFARELSNAQNMVRMFMGYDERIDVEGRQLETGQSFDGFF